MWNINTNWLKITFSLCIDEWLTCYKLMKVFFRYTYLLMLKQQQSRAKWQRRKWRIIWHLIELVFISKRAEDCALSYKMVEMMFYVTFDRDVAYFEVSWRDINFVTNCDVWSKWWFPWSVLEVYFLQSDEDAVLCGDDFEMLMYFIQCNRNYLFVEESWNTCITWNVAKVRYGV